MQRAALAAAAACDAVAGSRQCGWQPAGPELAIDATGRREDVPPQPAARKARTETAVEPTTIDFCTLRTEADPSKAALKCF
jgi:hypothetical protein